MKIETKESLIFRRISCVHTVFFLNAFVSNFDVSFPDSLNESEGECSDKGSQGSSGHSELSSTCALNDLSDLGI